jgi:hypothetical protein
MWWSETLSLPSRFAAAGGYKYLRALAYIVMLNNRLLARAVYKPVLQPLTAALSSVCVADLDRPSTSNAIDVLYSYPLN